MMFGLDSIKFTAGFYTLRGLLQVELGQPAITPVARMDKRRPPRSSVPESDQAGEVEKRRPEGGALSDLGLSVLLRPPPQTETRTIRHPAPRRGG